jgi:hypothetical protein
MVLSAVILATYAPALKLGFFGDDYLFIEAAGRSSSLPQYLSMYFDPRLQTAWYRPMQGMRYGIIYALLGAEPLAYHSVNVLVHIANCLLLFGIVWRLSRHWRIAMTTTLIYAGLPLYSVAVFWPGVADFVMTLFYLAAVLSWVFFSQEGRRAYYILAIVFFVLALLTKELAVTLPVVLFVVDRILIRTEASVRALVKRYLPYLLILLVYLPVEYQIQSRGIFVNAYGYGTGSHAILNLVQYLATLAFPWMLPEPWNYIWLVGTIFLFGYVVFSKKSLALLCLAGIEMLTLLPVIPFPWFSPRYLYLPVTISAIFLALLFDLAWTRLARWKWFAPATFAAIVLILLGNGLGVAASAAEYAEIARQSRVPFRDIAQRHPTFPEDTYLYFIDPLPQVGELSGMFFLRYGPRVSVSGNTGGAWQANLRSHTNSYVIYFDEQQRTRELFVEQAASTQVLPPLPADFTAPLRLEGYELANTHLKPGEPIIVILYWRATSKLEKNYTVFLHLLDTATGQMVAGFDEQPRKSATSLWRAGEVTPKSSPYQRIRRLAPICWKWACMIRLPWNVLRSLTRTVSQLRMQSLFDHSVFPNEVAFG